MGCTALNVHILHLRVFVSRLETLPASFKASKSIYRLMFIILTSLWEVAVCLVTFTDLVVLGAHNGSLLTSCSNWCKTSRSSFTVSFFPPSMLHCWWLTFRNDFTKIAKLRICEEKLLNRIQRSTQPWILLFSLETLICNRSPLPLSPLQPT